jgi:hypothetical protein
VVEGARLESVFRGNSNVGSNPTLSAMTSRIYFILFSNHRNYVSCTTFVSSALSAFSVQFAPWDAFCMTTTGMHDNGKRVWERQLPHNTRNLGVRQGHIGLSLLPETSRLRSLSSLFSRSGSSAVYAARSGAIYLLKCSSESRNTSSRTKQRRG